MAKSMMMPSDVKKMPMSQMVKKVGKKVGKAKKMVANKKKSLGKY